MPFTFQAQTNARLLTATARRLTRVYALGGGALFVLMALGFAVLLHDLVLAGGQLAGALVFAFWFPAAAAKRAVQQNEAKLARPTAYTVDHEGIRVFGGFQDTRWAWSQVTRVESWRGQIAVFLGWRTILGLPTDGLTPLQRSELLSLLKSRGAAA